MSGFKEHCIGGTIASAPILIGTYIYTKNSGVAIMFAVSVFVGSLVPDIDCGSVPSRWFARLGIILAAFLMYHGYEKQAAITGIVYMALSSGKHRGITHSWMLIIVCLVVGTLATIGKLPSYFILMAPFSVGLFVHSIVIDRK